MPSDADQQQCLAAELVDQAHAEEGGEQIDEADAHGLQRRRVGAEAGRGEDVVRVVEDRVDAGELVEEADRDGEEDRRDCTCR